MHEQVSLHALGWGTLAEASFAHSLCCELNLYAAN
jgi:hypothetical protein